MSHERLRNIILERSKELEFEILDTQRKVDGCVVFLKHAMIHIENDNNVSISFHVSARPDIAAITTLMINEIEDVNEIFVSDIFLFSGDKKDFLVGEKAIDKWEENRASYIINTYIKERNLSDWFNSCTNGPTA